MALNINSENELHSLFLTGPNLFSVPEMMIEYARQFQETMMVYNSAIKEVRTRLEVLNDELSIKNRRNPIEIIKSRVKKPESIIEKLTRRNLELNLEVMTKNLDDIAGVRVICSFVDDIYEIANMLVRQDDIRLINIKDYIKNPKPNGYRSYHMIIEVPVFFSEKKQFIRVELQIRTIAMDFWASVEHKIKYKKQIKEAEQIIKELKTCADIISETDLKLLELRKKIENKDCS